MGKVIDLSEEAGFDNSSNDSRLSSLEATKDFELQILTRQYEIGEAFRHTDGLNYRTDIVAPAGETPTTDPAKFTKIDTPQNEDIIPLFLIDQVAPTNLADITVDGNYCVRNVPADLAAQGITGHTRGDILRLKNTIWTFVLSPIPGTTYATVKNQFRRAIFSDDPTVGVSPLFVNHIDTGEPFSLLALATDLPGQIGFDGTEITGNFTGGLTTVNFNNTLVLIVSGVIAYWIEDTVNPERSGMYNLVVNDAGTGAYTLRRAYGFRSSTDFTDGQTFFVSFNGGDVAGNNFIIALDQQFVINTNSISILEGKVSKAAIASTIATEKFAFSQASFFGERGVPSSNENGNWTEINSTEINLLNDIVRGVPKLVVRFRDTNTGIQTAATLPVSAAQWSNMFTFGGEFGGLINPVDISGSFNFFFMGVGVSGANNPTASNSNQRFGAFIKKDPLEEFIVVDETEGPLNVVLDGTGGKPLVERGDYFDIFISIDIGFTDPRWIVNGIDIGAAAILDNSNTLDEVTIASGSSGGVGNIFDVDNFGITILEELTTKTISLTAMSSDIVQVITPPIIRDFEIIVPDNAGRKLGSAISLILNNVGGTITIRAFNLSAPQALINGLKLFIANVVSVKEFSIINTIENGNVYIGNISFGRASGVLHNSVTFPVGTTTNSLTFDTNPPESPLKKVELVGGLGGSQIKSLIDEEVFLHLEPQFKRTQVGGEESIVLWSERSTDNGATWTKELAIQVQLQGDDTRVSPLTAILCCKNDRVRFRAQGTVATSLEFIAKPAGTVTSDHPIIAAYILTIS